MIGDVRTDARTAAAADRYEALGVRAFITTPVKYHDCWVGALNCVSRTPRGSRGLASGAIDTPPGARTP